jgi:hypothetical protein
MYWVWKETLSNAIKPHTARASSPLHEIPRVPGVGSETYIGDVKAKLISVDTYDAGDRLKIRRDQQLLGVPG